MSSSFPNTLRISTFNVLADCYSQSGYPTFESRKDLLEDIFLNVRADILCLQEVDHYEDFYLQALDKAGFSTASLYEKRSGRKDGCLIAYQPDKLTLQASKRVDYDDLTDVYKGDEFKAIDFKRANLAIVALFTKNDDEHKELCIANTHIYWNPSRPEVKAAQASYLLTSMSDFCKQESQMYKASKTLPPALVCGDFNSMPDSSLYQKLITGTLLQQSSTMKNSVFTLNPKDLGMLYGKETKFLCDVSLLKICKWLRILGINARSETEESHKKRTQKGDKDFSLLFDQARRENRVLLTSSRAVFQRRDAPQSYMIDTQNFEGSLVDIVKTFGLIVTEDTFLTVCGKCGGKIRKTESRDDPALVDVEYLPPDRPIFVCEEMDCGQAYWWNDRVDSSPARAMRVASRLYSIIQKGEPVAKKEANMASCIYASGITEEEMKRENKFLTGKIDTDAIDMHHKELAEKFNRRDEVLIKREESEMHFSDYGGSTLIESTTTLSGATAVTADLLHEESMKKESSMVDSVQRQHYHKLMSAFKKRHNKEPVATNWCGNFIGTLDYIFLSDNARWRVHNARIYPNMKEVEQVEESDVGMEETDHPHSRLIVQSSCPNEKWPSDHFLLECEVSWDE